MADQFVTQAECASHVGNMIAQMKELGVAVATLEHRLYCDNGTPSIQSRINRLSTVCWVLVWATGAVAVATIGTTISVFINFAWNRIIA